MLRGTASAGKNRQLESIQLIKAISKSLEAIAMHRRYTYILTSTSQGNDQRRQRGCGQQHALQYSTEEYFYLADRDYVLFQKLFEHRE